MKEEEEYNQDYYNQSESWFLLILTTISNASDKIRIE